MTIETIGRHRDGTRFPVRVIATPDPTNDGRMIATVEDIAARVLSEFHLSMPPQEPRIQPLTESEMAVLRLVARGVENEHIAQAALYALRQGWVTLDEPPAWFA